MTKEEFEAKQKEMRSEIENADSIEKVKEIEKRASDLKAEYEAQENTKIVKRSAFNAQKAMESRKEDKTMENTVLEQRQAFRHAMERRADAQTTLADVAIPDSVTSMLKMDKSIGNVLANTTTTQYPWGVRVAVMDAVADEGHWVSEGASAEQEKASQVTTSFTANKVQKDIAITREVQKMSLPEYESQVAVKALTSITKAVEKAILVGAGTGSPLGIAKAEGVPEVNFEASYAGVANIIATLDGEYDANARFYMNKRTFETLRNLTDKNGQTLGYVNIEDRANPVLRGYPVVFTSALPQADTATNGEAVIVFGDMSRYFVNFVEVPEVEEYNDHKKDGKVVRATALVDGKAVIKEAFVVAKKPTA